MRSVISPVLIFSTILASTLSADFAQFRLSHHSQSLTAANLSYVWSLADKDNFKRTVDNILIPRVVGSRGHEKVHNYIVKELKDLNWDVETDEFHDTVPILGRLKFKNIIASVNPNAERFLVLACHYDSKYFPNDEFLGATDSAVPCAMMLNLAKTLAPLLMAKTRNDDSLSLKFIFFDGEEAFDKWGPRDSIYGAKHLARKLSKKTSLSRGSNEQVTDLERIDLLILLDLLGPANPSFYNFFEQSSKWYELMMKNEGAFKKLGLLENHSQNYFPLSRVYSMGIEDDHIPFLIRDVPILHLIPYPFPKEWHTPKDDRSIIDWATMNNLNTIWRAFVVEYLHLCCPESSSEEQKQQGRPEKEL